MASDDFNKASASGWQLYGAVTGFTTSIGMGVFGLAMYTKPEASGWWLAMGIIGVLGAAGSIYNFVNLLKQETRTHKPPQDDPAGPKGDGRNPGDEPPRGPQP